MVRSDLLNLGAACGIPARRLSLYSWNPRKPYTATLCLNAHRFPGWRKKWARFRRAAALQIPVYISPKFTTRAERSRT